MSKNSGYPVQQQRITTLARQHGSERDYRAAETMVMLRIENTEYIEEGRLLSFRAHERCSGIVSGISSLVIVNLKHQHIVIRDSRATFLKSLFTI